MTAIRDAARYAASMRDTFTTRDVVNAAKLNATTTGHVLRALEAVGIIEDLGRRGWRPKGDDA